MRIIAFITDGPAGSPPWCRRRASIATATSMCWGRWLTGNFGGDVDRFKLAVSDELHDSTNSVEKLATRNLGEKSTAQNRPGSTIVTRGMVGRPRKTSRRMSLRSFSTELADCRPLSRIRISVE
jgi:hypothetical protein